MRRRALVAAVAGWVTVVGATSAVAWVAIDRAGREVLTATSDARGGAGAVTTGAPHTPRASRPSAAPTAAGSPTSSRTSTTSAPRVTSSSASRTHTSTAPPASTSTSSRPSPTSTTARPATVDRTVRVEGGQVGARCVGRTVSLRFAQPADGWAVQVEDDGPDKVKVTFRSSGERREIEVEAECSGGTPVFSTSDDEHSDNDSPGDD